MMIRISNIDYEIIVEKKAKNKNTYIRVKDEK